MPLTPLHFGLNTSVGIIFKKYINIPMCVLSNVIIDIQPFLVVFFDCKFELHGFSHTLIGGSAIMLPVSVIFGLIRKKITKQKISIVSYILGGEVGVLLHLFLDSLMHSDMVVFLPFSDFVVANEHTKKFVNPVWIAGYILMILLIIINTVLRIKRKP
ncbi:MAG: metal-dependent hydrolase [Spirochaetales bacterium]|nr:metal-dependent hydrolase [Spirochaetales bacterium]